MDNLLIFGRNAVLEILRDRNHAQKQTNSINAMYVQTNSKGLGEHFSLAKKLKLVVKEVPQSKLDEMSEGERHGGVIVALSAVEYVEISELLPQSDQAPPPFLLLCDGIEDPHNLGALIRTAEAAGVTGIILPKRRNVSVTSAVYTASAGAAAHMKIARVTNLVDTIKLLKENGFWVYGAEADGEPYTKVDFSGSSIALIIGSEGRGLSRLVRESCDVVVSVPMHGKINSLNASVCGGVLMFEIAKVMYKLEVIK
ncbi:MAG: 23S rRNA (guanosine(2251)-2'-O)-methyltransferase RlmB [Oscillospiraceae bacterium]|nr:23S rRNA (guanosine(2251)-2'-O)-methyltransferase RlmB [Oscillospiraceae bacterium]